MFRGIFDSIFILIPLAIIIGRFVYQARNKKRKPPPRRPPQPHIRVHFEDDVDEEAAVRKAVTKAARPIPAFESFDRFVPPERHDLPSAIPAEKKFSPASREQAVYKKPEAETRKTPLPASQAQNDFFLRLNKLSPLKQAVVMAEVLGPPKALQ